MVPIHTNKYLLSGQPAAESAAEPDEKKHRFRCFYINYCLCFASIHLRALTKASIHGATASPGRSSA